MRRTLTILAAAGALALTAIAAPTSSYARAGYVTHHHHYARHYGWGAFHGSACDFRNFSRDRQLNGTC
jgi:hypothetical protein